MSEETVRSSVRLIICVDGTWDTSEGSYDAVKGALSGSADSIKSINDMVKKGTVEDSAGNKFDQRVYYFQGVGTAESAKPSNLDYPGMHLVVRATSTFQGATGEGYLEILKKAYKVCCAELDGENDDIFMFGFSRGAFIVRALASMLQHVGLIKLEHMRTDSDFEGRFHDLLRRYSDITSKKIKFMGQSKNDLDLLPFCKPSSRVRFIGAFDTVKAVFQLPVRNTLNHGVPFIDFEQDAPQIVDHFRHALALNEGRPLFNPTLWKSDGKSTESSYLEAWFLGFHHDIGGGAGRQGLGLWPLQWILRAATDKGLVLDNQVERYTILFSGEGNVIESPHDIAMRMFDMIRHHIGDKRFSLHLNETSWGFLDTPRNYLEYLTTPPYLTRTKPRVFLHPSSYLVFDISLPLRIQLYEWKLFNEFIRDRYLNIPPAVVPWWENQTVENILKENSFVDKMRILVYGRPNIGKSSLINRTFGKWTNGGSKTGSTVLEIDKSVSPDIGTPIKFPENAMICIHYSDGFGTDGSDNFEAVNGFVTQYRENTNPENQLHAIWYCLDCTDTEISDSEKQFFKMNFGDIPIVVVLMKEDELKSKIRQDLAKEHITDEKKIEEHFNKIIDQKKEELKQFSPRSFVPVGSNLDSIKRLLSETFLNLKDMAVQLTQIKAQRVSVRPKVALATDESIRAYAIWKKHKFEDKQVIFCRNPKDQPKLSRLLMAPVLESFNVRFPGDDNLIQSQLGKAWRDLDKYPANLWDKNIPGDLILLCMMDTIIIVTRAFYHQQILDKPLGDIAQPLHSTAIELACSWYTLGVNNRQRKVHSRIKSLLSEQDWSPKDKSMGDLQMKLIETIDVGLESAETFLEGIGTSVLGGAKKVVGGIGTGLGFFS